MNLMNRLFYDGYCVCGYRKINDDESIYIPKPKQQLSYINIQLPKRYWIADPFLVQEENEVFLFVEIYDRYKSKAYLGVMPLYPNKGELREVFEFDAHSSYPCVFKWNDQYYMVPESGARRKLSLLRCIDFPYEWEEVAILDDEADLADCTVFNYEGSLKVFLYERLSKSENNLSVADLNIEKGRLENVMQVVHYDDNNGRCGGNVFVNSSGDYIRVVQPGTKRYGEKIEFYKFSISGGGYKEEKIGEITPEQIEMEGVKFNGTHTFNRCGGIEVIDVLYDKQFNLLRPFRIMLQLLKIGVFDLGDRRRTYVYDKYIGRLFTER